MEIEFGQTAEAAEEEGKASAEGMAARQASLDVAVQAGINLSALLIQQWQEAVAAGSTASADEQAAKGAGTAETSQAASAGPVVQSSDPWANRLRSFCVVLPSLRARRH